jgi:flagellar L-ring protein precursor FlgH
MQSKQIKRLVVIVFTIVFASGCASLREWVPRDASIETAVPHPTHEVCDDTLYNETQPEEGSLWVEHSARLFTDMRARHKGDIVTVRISESPSGKLNATTNTSRNSSIEAGIGDLLGYLKALESKNSRFDRTSMFKANFNPKFEGAGESTRDGEVTAYVAARVVHVFPNENLYIKGTREIKVNNETQYITISGTIRPEDISPNNEIASTYIADAHIEYSGKGVIMEKQRPGWLGRILDYIWPF